MIQRETIQTMQKYSDWANAQLLRAAARLDDAQLDQPFDVGRGSLRRTLLHIFAGESVWLARCQGKIETPWPSEDQQLSAVTLAEMFGQVHAQRDAFLQSVAPEALARSMVYRDSKGGLFTATLGDALMQMCLHSHHHRSQGVNILRRLGAAAPEVDYMMWLRKPA